MIRRATEQDLDRIMEIVGKVIPLMEESGNYQWFEGYPLKADFQADVDAGTLHVAVDGRGVVRAFVCLNGEQPPEYAGARWEGSGPFLVLHRMAVDPDWHGRGLAGSLMAHGAELAAERGMASLRSDTCSENHAMNRLFLKQGFKAVGTVKLAGPDHDYICYEKRLGTGSGMEAMALARPVRRAGPEGG